MQVNCILHFPYVRPAVDRGTINFEGLLLWTRGRAVSEGQVKELTIVSVIKSESYP